MSSPKISILIANYNNGHFFEECFKSLVNQTEPDWEAIVIDDASTDNSRNVVTELIRNDARFRFFKNEVNVGYQRTIIKAISLSNAEIFARLDPDDKLENDAIKLSVLEHEKNKNIGLVYSNIVICDENFRALYVRKGKQIDNSTNKIHMNWEIDHFASFKKSFYKKTFGIDPFNLRAEDQDIYYKMIEVAQVKYIDKDLYWHRLHTLGASTLKNEEKAYFWHWVAIINAAKRRNINIENQFTDTFIKRSKYDELNKQLSLLKKSRFIKLGQKLGLLKWFK